MNVTEAEGLFDWLVVDLRSCPSTRRIPCGDRSMW